jgi:DNA modification methylase
LSTVKQRVLRLAVNRLGENGEWNLEALRIEFEELILSDAPIEITGFTLDEIDQIVLGDTAQTIGEGPLAPEPYAIAIARLGDIFALGPHRLVCGDATTPETLRRLMQGDPPGRLVLTDEPYNVPIAGHVSGGAHREFAMASGEMTDAEFLAFNEAWMQAVLFYLCDGGVCCTFIDWRGLSTVSAAAAKLSLKPLNLIVWAKTNAGMGSLYRSQHELLPLFKKGTAPHVNNVELGKRGRWRSPAKDSKTIRLSSRPRRSRAMRRHARGRAPRPYRGRGEILIDPFLGSGSTLIAAGNTGRVCRGVELDSLYVDIIVRRYQTATGNPAVLAETGETFESLALRRASEAAPV